MANYPPPGQAHPDQPSDPWQEAPLWGGATPAPYGEPSGYIGEQYSPAPPFPPPNPQQPGQPGQPPLQVWGPPQPPNKPGLSTTAIALITAAAVIVLGGVVLGVYALSGNKGNTPVSQTSSGTTATGTTPTASVTPSERDFRTAAIGDCMVNRGSFDKPDLHFADCDAQDAWRVVARFDGTDDESKCQGIANSDVSYFYRRGEDRFVLCFHKL